jgi:DNA polymerase-3 subunit beta
MKFSISKNDLQHGLARLQAVVEKRNTMPILANVHLAAASGAEAGSLELAATDLEVGIRSCHPATVDQDGSVTTSARKLYEIVRELPDEPVRVEVSPNAYLSISCGRGAFTLAGNLPDEYPTLPAASPAQMTTMPAIVLGEMIERSMYAASTDETRYNLNGVYLEYLGDSGKLRMVATDGHRLAYVDRDVGTPVESLEKGVIIPRKALVELKRLVDEEDADEVQLGFEGSNGLVQKQGVTLVMRLIEGEFPNYRQVIPQELTQRLVVPIESLRQALRRVALLSSERSRAVKLQLTPGLLRLSASNPDLGEAQEDLDLDYAGKELTIAFNARYLLDCLNVLAGKEVVLSLQDEHSPTQLVPTDDEDTLAVVMPMRT